MTTPDALLPGFSRPDPAATKIMQNNVPWVVELASGERRTVEAIGWRVEGGALVMLRPVRIAAAYAAGVWRLVNNPHRNGIPWGQSAGKCVFLVGSHPEPSGSINGSTGNSKANRPVSREIGRFT